MKRILIANRGEIAVRLVRACRDAGLASIAVYADADADALHVQLADEAWALDGTAGETTYLAIDKLIAIARRAAADAVHPGYGFLSENADFARAVVEAGLIWIGPSAETIEALGNKLTAREIATRVGAPLAPGTDGPVDTPEAVRDFADEHGLPIIIKAAHGGGGRGMKIVHKAADIEDAFASAVRESEAAFGRGECFVERFLDRPRHVEAQILADTHGHIIVVGTRDCSLQRRNQKLVEEAPAPFLSDEQRQRIHDSARAICGEAGYVGAGTVEYLVAPDGLISFLEVNTRLQVEHPVTEATSGIDLVAEQFRIADGQALTVTEDPPPHGHALEFRLNAEDPARGFLPFPGTIERFEPPTGAGIRVDTGVRSGAIVPDAFDSLIAKLIVAGDTRAQALQRARAALDEFVITGLPTVIPFHKAVLREPAFTADDRFGVHTHWIETDFSERLAASDELAAAAPEADRRRFTIDLDGKAVQLGLPAALLNALGTAQTATADTHASDEADDNAVTATLSGTLVQWQADDGADVAEGDALAVLEAMKMETTISAPRAGTFERGDQQAGDAVANGDVLGRIG
ncbi:biotin carboxylase N-terminal domain-containing protein [Salinisphaera sp. Q1T1-3]|uniref:acetyl/propionyl/methylcrotonyl-CoA carboxylase subunit alpha n=1 Tax=Salinisphaera sp. Q1T1-3 TaxID=2321229 RepID=UPI000E7072AC|nr:biotin carboxylase N-terminal domain-containing protein [Salinisphaera sp. Q1T1-3]RJS91139.1 ATP-grasp domain-containing protein [Salinisphaera sp. Q1T1-3]